VIALDHIAVVAPDLASGVRWVAETLGVDVPKGGRHPQMGTHNHVLRLGDVFLEVIAVDEAADRPAQPRWFGLDDGRTVRREWACGRRLRAWVARSDHLEATLDALDLDARPMEISRGERRWRFGVTSDGALPADGALPHVIEWGAGGPAVDSMPDTGCALDAFIIETPQPQLMRDLLKRAGVRNAPEIRRGKTARLFAIIRTHAGVRLLT